MKMLCTVRPKPTCSGCLLRHRRMLWRNSRLRKSERWAWFRVWWLGVEASLAYNGALALEWMRANRRLSPLYWRFFREMRSSLHTHYSYAKAERRRTERVALWLGADRELTAACRALLIDLSE